MSKKNNEFSIEEYTSIRAELIERIKIMNSQEASALVAIITSWAAGFTFANEILTKKFIMLDSFGTVVFQCLQTFIFLIPIFYFVPLAIKSGENLTQMVSLSAYIRVFYDYPAVSSSSTSAALLGSRSNLGISEKSSSLTN